MRKRALARTVLLTAVFALPVSLAYVRYMEAVGRFDSIGWWYSMITSVVIGTPIALVLGAGLHFFARPGRR